MNTARAILLYIMLVWSFAWGQTFRITAPPAKLPLPYASSAKISPTGDRISFTGKGFNKLYVADIDGNDVQELCPHDAVG